MKVVVKTKETLSIKEYLIDIINNLKRSNTWKIQLAIAINFISSKGNDEEQTIIQRMTKK